jgi:hypothetical protein
VKQIANNTLGYVGDPLSQGRAVFLVSASLRFSGDLLLQGIPDHPGAPGSWVMLPLMQLTDTGSLQFQVSVCAHVCSRLAVSTCAAEQRLSCSTGCSRTFHLTVPQSDVAEAATDHQGPGCACIRSEGEDKAKAKLIAELDPYCTPCCPRMPLTHCCTRTYSRQAQPSCCLCAFSLQGVRLHGYSQPLLQEMDSLASGRPSVAQVNSSSVLVHLLTLSG